jgi:hypothetical protein
MSLGISNPIYLKLIVRKTYLKLPQIYLQVNNSSQEILKEIKM